MNLYQIELGYFNFQFIGLFLGICFWLFITSWYYSKNQIQREHLIKHLWQWFLAALIMGHVFNLILHPEMWVKYGTITPLIFWEYVPHYLGVILGITGSLFLTLRNYPEENVLSWLDSLVFPLFRTLLCIDIAFFMTGFIYGIETELPWGIAYETYGVDLLAPLHPVGIYLFIIHYFLYRYFRRKAPVMQKYPGKLIATSLLAITGVNFLMLFLRADQESLIWCFKREHFENIVLFALIIVGLKLQKIPVKFISTQ